MLRNISLPALVLGKRQLAIHGLGFMPIAALYIAALYIVLSLLGPWTTTMAQEMSRDLVAFTDQHCLDCHDGDSGEGGFDVNVLHNELADPVTFQRWVRTFDRVRQGEMPPAEAGSIEEVDKQGFLEATQSHLTDYQLSVQRREGRVKARRLTNVQLERTLQDLLAIDTPLARLMPTESRTHGFVNLADYQAMSHFQLETHLKVIDAALDAAFERALTDRSDWALDIDPDQIADKPKRKRNRDPEMREGLAVVWSGGPIYYGRISNARIPYDGWYKIEITASAVKKPTETGVWCSIRSGECVSSAPLMNWIGSFEVEESPRTWTFEGFIAKNHLLEIRPADTTLRKGRFAGGQVGVGEGESQNIPGLALHNLKIQQIHPGGSVAATRRRLFGESLFGEALTASDLTDAKSFQMGFESMSESEALDFLNIRIVEFARQAFRRPTDSQLLIPYIQLAQQSYRDDKSLAGALRTAYRAILCSPRFLYFVETVDEAGRLDAWSLASRLSYFICGSMPDQSLMQAAADGQLDSPKGVRQEATRLLETERGKKFIANFSSQWLDLVDIDATEPDPKLYREFDVVVQAAMLDETHRFLQHQFDNDLPIGQLVGADYTFLNSRLARYYGIEGVDGDELRLVHLNSDSERGGIFGQGSIHKVTANGNDTSPVLRGIWVSERLLGIEIPPPPSNVPAVEPDVRGATTIRELLAKHQSDESCASCHRQIDPPGFALENFDAAGQWRDRYLQLVGGKYKFAAKIDSVCEMPDGRKFESFFQFRDMVANDQAALAKGLAKRLMVYGTGAEVSFADRQAIQKIVADVSADGYGFQTIFHRVLASDPFLMK